jgi:RimJ/RimL family protein N-acetyltransferase
VCYTPVTPSRPVASVGDSSRRVDSDATSHIAFVTADSASLEAFLSVSAASQYQPQLREYAESLLRQESTKLDWCVLGMDAGAPVARAALWSLPGQTVPTDIVLIDADWNDSELTAGRALLQQTHQLSRALGAESLTHHVDSPPGPPQYQEDEDARIRLLEVSAYELLRDGLRWTYSGTAPFAPGEPSLVFRPLPDVGEDAFVEAIASTYHETRDSWINRLIEERGMLGAARADFLDYQDMEHLPEWWELGFAEDGSLAGVIMAARNPSSAVIAYVGVVPSHRGRGLARHLVHRGTQRLLESGATEIRGDCDRDNVAMVKAFERAGYVQFARRRSYHRSLTVADRSQ